LIVSWKLLISVFHWKVKINLCLLIGQETYAIRLDEKPALEKMPKVGWSCLIENSTFPLLSISASLTTITENKLNKSKNDQPKKMRR